MTTLGKVSNDCDKEMLSDEQKDKHYLTQEAVGVGYLVQGSFSANMRNFSTVDQKTQTSFEQNFVFAERNNNFERSEKTWVAVLILLTDGERQNMNRVFVGLDR